MKNKKPKTPRSIFFRTDFNDVTLGFEKKGDNELRHLFLFVQRKPNDYGTLDRMNMSGASDHIEEFITKFFGFQYIKHQRDYHFSEKLINKIESDLKVAGIDVEREEGKFHWEIVPRNFIWLHTNLTIDKLHLFNIPIYEDVQM